MQIKKMGLSRRKITLMVWRAWTRQRVERFNSKKLKSRTRGRETKCYRQLIINNEEQEAQPKTENSVEYLPEVPNPQQNTSIFLTFAMQLVKLKMTFFFLA